MTEMSHRSVHVEVVHLEMTMKQVRYGGKTSFILTISNINKII